jgi:hypothetical protein
MPRLSPKPKRASSNVAPLPRRRITTKKVYLWKRRATSQNPSRTCPRRLPRLTGAAFTDGRLSTRMCRCRTLLQACIRCEFPSSRKRGLSGDREGRIHVAAIPFGVADAGGFVLVGDPPRIHLISKQCRPPRPPSRLWLVDDPRLRRKSRITHLESVGARTGLSSPWVGRRPM